MLKPLIFLGHLEQRLKIATGNEKFIERLENRIGALQTSDRLLGLLLMVPKIGLRHLLFNGLDFGLLASVVKESLGVGESFAGSLRRGL